MDREYIQEAKKITEQIFDHHLVAQPRSERLRLKLPIAKLLDINMHEINIWMSHSMAGLTERLRC